ncbi:trypsin-like serine peptidase [Pseudomonas mosselii]|uniref:trypsin-like serine peptidase n=1 Tax=Pseudomonas mosselii TaxID=78327 RepID=UPI001F4C1F7F|nr:serine protease [Pseudomonas mosselii]MCH7419927.1 serine protease [Pseudomonas mosselii]
MPMPPTNALASVLALTTLNAIAAQAVPTPLTNANGENAHWTGIGRLSVPPYTQCIATLIDSREQTSATNGPAYVLTSGHCLSTRNGQIVHDAPAQGTITFNYFIDTPDTRAAFPLKRTVWSSVQGSDLALVELQASLADVMAAGVEPLTLGKRAPAGSEVVMVGEPSRPDSGLRAAYCKETDVDSVTDFPWVWRKLKTNDCPTRSEGASGSPVIERANGRVVSVLNSAAVGQACAPGGACTPMNNFAIPVQRVMGCFRNAHVDLSVEGCDLLPGFQLAQKPPIRLLKRVASDAQGQPLPATWNMSFSLDTPYYRYKTVRDALACEDPVGYSATLASSENHIDDPIGSQPGRYHLCLIGVQSADQLPSPALMANALSVPLELLAEGSPQVRYSIDRHQAGHVRINWQTDQPYLRRYVLKLGKPDAVDCTNPFGYRRALMSSQVITAAQLPVTLCSRAIDLDGQVSATRSELLSQES